MFTFFFFYGCLYGGSELFHTLLCFAAQSWQSHQMSSGGVQRWSPGLMAQCGAVPLFLNAISNIHFPDNSPRNPSCDLHLWIPSSKYFWNWFYFCSNFLLLEFLLFLSGHLISSGFLCSFISTNPIPVTLELWEILQNFWFVEDTLPCFSGA